MTMTINETPRVWVGCLGCYNAGDLVGFWIDADEAVDVTEPREMFGAEIRANGQGHYPSAHDVEQHEEFWVFDHENFHGLLTGECSPATAKELAEVLESVDNPEAYGAYAQNVGTDYATPEGFEESFCGEYDSEQDYAQTLAEELGAVNEDAGWPNNCIDWERATRDLFMDYSSHRTGRGTVYVFRSI